MSASSSNVVLVPNGNLVFAGSGGARTMTVSTASGKSGTALITIRVSDGSANGTITASISAGGNGNDTLTGMAARTSCLARTASTP